MLNGLEEPAINETLDEVRDESMQVKLCAEEATEVRGLAARDNNLSQDRR